LLFRDSLALRVCAVWQAKQTYRWEWREDTPDSFVRRSENERPLQLLVGPSWERNAAGGSPRSRRSEAPSDGADDDVATEAQSASGAVSPRVAACTVDPTGVASLVPAGVCSGTFSSSEQLARWLQRHGVDTSCWGREKAKSVADLRKEIEAVESTLEVVDGCVARVLSVINVVVRNNNNRERHLACIQQTYADGRVRERKRGKQFPSVKMIAGEV
jgi:hypothetical protein